MKNVLNITGLVLLAFVFIGCATLPDSVASQSRKDFEPTEEWAKFDKSGEVKFLQVQGTAAASEKGTGMALDGSIGEKLIEIKTEPMQADAMVEWSVKNKNENSVYVVATSCEGLEVPYEIKGNATTEFKTMLGEEGYGYIVVDSENGGKVEVEFKAKAGGKDAKTTKGSSMKVLWF